MADFATVIAQRRAARAETPRGAPPSANPLQTLPPSPSEATDAVRTEGEGPSEPLSVTEMTEKLAPVNTKETDKDRRKRRRKEKSAETEETDLAKSFADMLSLGDRSTEECWTLADVVHQQLRNRSEKSETTVKTLQGLLKTQKSTEGELKSEIEKLKADLVTSQEQVIAEVALRTKAETDLTEALAGADAKITKAADEARLSAINEFIRGPVMEAILKDLMGAMLVESYAIGVDDTVKHLGLSDFNFDALASGIYDPKAQGEYDRLVHILRTTPDGLLKYQNAAASSSSKKT